MLLNDCACSLYFLTIFLPKPHTVFKLIVKREKKRLKFIFVGLRNRNIRWNNSLFILITNINRLMPMNQNIEIENIIMCHVLKVALKKSSTQTLSD